MNFIIDIPKKEHLGEDAPPINISSTNECRSLIAVFDGLGGSGSSLYDEDGITHTGAYIASRQVRETIFTYFKDQMENDEFEISSELIENLKQQIKKELEDKLKKQKFGQSKLKSSLIRTFPTTLALAITNQKQDNIEIDLLWAGDSRVYILSPKEGLVQVTKDDLKIDNDPFENIENDSPLSNMIHLDDEFTINHTKQKFEPPFFIIAATDGCFGYFPTPMHFENLLIDDLSSSNDENEWKEKITSDLKLVSGDDFSLSLSYIGKDTPNFEAIKTLFRNRQEDLYREYMKDIHDLETKLSTMKKELKEFEDKRKSLHKSLWERYKSGNYQCNKIDSQ